MSVIRYIETSGHYELNYNEGKRGDSAMCPCMCVCTDAISVQSPISCDNFKKKKIVANSSSRCWAGDGAHDGFCVNGNGMYCLREPNN